MELSGDMPVTLIIKAPNQHMADQTVDCMLGWTIQKLKRHLENVYPTKPKHNEQRLIYSGKLLQDHLTLKEILRQYDSSLLSQHTVHLVCSPTTEPSPSVSTPSPAPQKPAQVTPSSSVTSPSPEPINTDNTQDVRYRGHGQLPESFISPGSAGMYAAYQRGAVAQGPMGPYTPEQYAWFMQQQQQVYSQYMMQYMMYYQNLYNPGMPFSPMMPSSTFPHDAAINPHPPQPQPAQEAAAAVNNVAPDARRPNVRINAQGGMEEEDDDEGEPRDWLHHIYFFMRVLTFMGILFFYSSLTRFLVVCAGSVVVYCLQKFRKYLQRAQQQQQQQQSQPPPPPQPQQGQGVDNQQQPAEPQADVRNQETPVQPDAPQSGPDGDGQQAAVVEENSWITRMLLFACNTVQSFFTSLLPTPPELLERN
jgi:hypothetical protein